jgi:hypothetical protein
VGRTRSNAGMETLGLSDSTPRTEGRLKSLFWPSVQTGADVDYLGSQGYWVCAIIAASSFVFLAAMGQPMIGLLLFLYYYLGGVGVRERSRYAAIAVFVFYAVDMVFSGASVFKILFSALLLANVRATWIAGTWRPESDEAALPPRLNETLGDKFADQLPMWLWPKVRILYYVYTVGLFIAFDVGLAAAFARRPH